MKSKKDVENDLILCKKAFKRAKKENSFAECIEYDAKIEVLEWILS
jgi:hypothetical protein